MDCPICYDNIKISAIGSCTHHFCYSCLIDWCKKGGTSCPVCKTPINMIRKDIEFDMILGNNIIELENIQRTIRINFFLNSEDGITLENNFQNGITRIPGVKVGKINKDKICYKNGIRKGDIILFINKIPCIDHAQVIKIIDNAVSANSSITLIMQ